MGVFLFLLNRLAYRIGAFFQHYYVYGSRAYANKSLNVFEALDRRLAFRITGRSLFQPLYGDYSVVGYALGFFFRLGRLGLGAAVYVFLALLSILIYLAYVFLPIFLISSPWLK